ncbi:ABC transporter ATP-binding protein [Roseovarius arcticus]|uniref:ABC transporter ATP-binding protein n=1 Tax=Roseovarius arcticus TaxID=2547404 RepID=UPI001BB143CF|nr:ABC transporter ATP-binding protein [Roseovarius arcticus]
MDTTKPILSIRNLTVALPVKIERANAVENLTFDVRPKEILCVVGESGSGKSITSLATMGLLSSNLKITSGTIEFDGRDVLSLSPNEHNRLRGDRMAMIFQEPMTALNPAYTVGQQIEEVIRVHRSFGAAERRQRVMKLLEEVRLPDPERLFGSFPHQLSGGQRQRIMIAMALALDPKLLIADEPTTALDVTTQAQILHLLKQLNAEHDAGIMFITHDFSVVAEIADRVVVMRHGQIVEQGTADEILNNPQHPYTRALIDAVPRRAEDREEIESTSPPVIEVKSLNKTFHSSGGMFKQSRTVAAVRDVSFQVRRGETLGIVGESGSGKTTLVRCLMRLIDPDSGSINISGVDFAAKSAAELRQHRKDIQIVFQDPYGSLNPRRTIGSQLIQGAVNFGVSRKEAWERVYELLDIVRMPRYSIHRYPSQFSGGQRQRLCIARALVVKPKVLIADEAVSALDVSIQREVLKLINDIRDQMGLTVIFITHDLRVAAQICDDVIVMKHGEVVERGNVSQIFNAPQHEYTKALIAAQPGQGWEIPSFPEFAPQVDGSAVQGVLGR